MDPLLAALTRFMEEETPFVPWVDYIPVREGTCDECRGMGYTDDTAPEIRKERNGKPYTHLQGSGCPKCHGNGMT